MSINTKNHLYILFEPTRKIVPQLILIIILLLLSSVAALSMPWLAGKLTESLTNNSNSLFNQSYIFLFLAIAILLQSFATFGSGYLSDRTGEEVLVILRTKIFSKLQNAKLSIYDHYSPGQLLSLVTNDAEIISHFITRTSIGIFPQVITFLGAVFALCVINFKLGIACVIVATFFIFLVKILGKSIRPTSKLLIQKYGELVGHLDENIKLISVIKSFSLESNRAAIYKSKNDDYLSISKNLFLQKNIISPAIQGAGGLIVLAGVWFLLHEVKQNNLTVAELVSILLYGMLVTRPLTNLGAIYGQSQMFLAAVSRISNLLNEAQETLTISQNETTYDNSITFDEVSFNYPKRPPIFQNLSLKAEHGETLSIIGDNGSGKSTIVKLLLGFLTPNQGSIFIGNVNINDLGYKKLRSKIAYVPQETKLFNSTIRDNIKLNDIELSDPTIKTVLEIVGANDLLAALPDGLDTEIGDMGMWLSGGQRQKIALARAVIKRPDILILDEATSMFDPNSEETFIRKCQNYLDKTTIINITHRPASLEASDRVIRM